MKILKLFLTLTFLYLPSLSVADSENMNESKIEADKMLNIMGIDKAYEESISIMLDFELQQNPSLAPYKTVMLNFFEKHMSYESLKPELIKIYSEEFTLNELREINDFYTTDTGKKTIEKVSTLMEKGAQIGSTRVQENIGELREMISAESERIQKLQAQ